MRLYRESEVVTIVRGISRRRLRAWVRRGLVAPRGGDGEYLFDEVDLARLRLLGTIREEMGIGEAELPLVMSLLDQIYGLRRQLRRLVEALADLPEEQRSRILERLAQDGRAR